MVLVLYLLSIGIDEARIGALLTLTLAGDILLSLVLTTRADSIGRRRVLVAGGVLMAAAATVFALTNDYTLLVIAAIVGVISPSGKEVGPFLPIEQVALTEVAPDRDRTALFAWYNLSGSFAIAIGSLAAGTVAELLGYRSIIIVYALLGVVMAILFSRLTPKIEAPVNRPENRHVLQLHRSSNVVLRLSGLFALDSFAGGLIVQSVVAYWFHRRFGVSAAALGAIFFVANIVAGISALGAARIARRFGLLHTMVFTHLPSNVLLLLVPFMPTFTLALTVLLVRFTISHMDVPTRQAYVMAVVDPTERSAAAGITGVARTTGAALAPVLAMPLLGSLTLDWIPFVVAGTLKIIYDLALLRGFRNLSA